LHWVNGRRFPGLLHLGQPFFASCLAQRFDAKAVEAFAGGEGFGGKATVRRGFEPQHKLPV
jgi:hypothetical protein